MTPVEFHFITPDGVPINNAAIEVQISQAGYDAITPGILMPRLLTVNTDADGKAMISLVSSDIMYFVTATDSGSEAALFYKFIVPPLATGVTYVRLQDILVEGPLPQVPYDEATLLAILTAKANAMSAAATAVEAVEQAAPVAADAAAAAITATAQAAIATTKASEASTSAATASTGATTATTQAGISTTQAAESAASATTASGAATTATTAAGTASTAATTATTQAGIATTGGTTATTQAGIATTAAGVASAAATQTIADSAQTALDRIATAADRVQTGLDRAATTADRTQTVLDAAATAADRVVTTADKTQTILDAAATAADRVQTGLDRTAAAGSATTASTGAGTATTKAAEAASSAADAAASAALAASTVTGVSTVNGRSGAVVLTKADVSLSNADNTSDANKPVSTAQAAADTAIGSAAATDATTKANAAQAAAIAASTPVSHLGSGGTAHANVVASGAAGFMSGADKTKLDAITGANSGDETGARIATLHHAASAKTTLVDADELTGQDSAAGFGLIRVTWANIKATLATWIGGGTIAGSFTTLASSGNTTLGDATTDTCNIGNGGIIKDASGNVGIGIAPSAKLDVLAAANQRFMVRERSTGGVTLDALNATNTLYMPMFVGSAQTQFQIGGANMLLLKFDGSVLQLFPAGLGYGTGAGGTVTQATSKSTAVTLNKPTGQITMHNAALAAGALVSMQLNNTLVSITDTCIVSLSTAGTSYTAYNIQATTFNTGVVITLKNISSGPLSEAVVVLFTIIKGATT